MRKLPALALSVLFILIALAGCGSGTAETPVHTDSPTPIPATEAPTPKPTPEPTQTPAEPTSAPADGTPAPAEVTPADPCSPYGTVLFEKDGIKVTAEGLDRDPTTENFCPIIWLTIENTGKEDVCLGVSNGSVNGFMSDVVLINFEEEDGVYHGAEYVFSLSIPADSLGRYALGYYGKDIPGMDTDTLETLQFCFTTAKDEYTWPDYSSGPVTVVTGETVKTEDLASFGTVMIDDEKLKLVMGEQDYDYWFGPRVCVYAENKTDHFIGISAESAEADGAACDSVYYYSVIAPGKRGAEWMCFAGDIRELKGFENLRVELTVLEGETPDALSTQNRTAGYSVAMQYPPQVWGTYACDGYTLEIQPRYNELVTVETGEPGGDGLLFSVSETASMEAEGFDGAGWLFSIAKVSEDALHDLLCYDMSGAEVFAKDGSGSYFLLRRPTDVRFARAAEPGSEEWERGIAQWTMLCAWVESAADRFKNMNGLDYASYGNSQLELILARAAWLEDEQVTLSATEYGAVDAGSVDGTPYVEYLLQRGFSLAEPEEMPDGEYIVLQLPEEDARVDFFLAPGGYVRVTAWGTESLCQALWYDDSMSAAEVVLGWYYAAAENAGVKAADESLDPCCGQWHESIAGRCIMEITESLAPGKLKIWARWPGSAFEATEWELIAVPDGEGRFVYKNGHMTVTEYGEDGKGWITEESWEESGWFSWNDQGELTWHDDRADWIEESVFVR